MQDPHRIKLFNYGSLGTTISDVTRMLPPAPQSQERLSALRENRRRLETGVILLIEAIIALKYAYPFPSRNPLKLMTALCPQMRKL